MLKVNPYHILNLTPKVEFPCLSLYAESERELVSMLGKAEELGLKEYDAKTLDLLFKPVHNFLKKAEVGGSPMALFSSKGFAGYSLLPFPAKPLAVVASSFHVKPLLKWMQREHPFSLLWLKNREAVLFQGSLSYFEEIERLSYRELRSMDGLFNALDRAVYRSIQGSKVPLLLAGEFDLIEAFKGISGYNGIVDDSIIDPSALEAPEKIHRAAISVMEPFLERRESFLINAYWAAERGGRSCGVLQEIVQLALASRVKHLFVNEKMHVWGKINSHTASFTYSPRQTGTEDDVLDDLAEIVLRKSGAVTVLPAHKMPDGKAACAILNGYLASTRQNLAPPPAEYESWRPQPAL
jgi:hypothetical protein